ncbi:cysteine-rich receptor-like protein kinase 25 [Camellia sinensis]|uniref:cysteine-rich receptor-like protein kinase 25 n=1 Tax=Camellia sinensis TaxID=4442 RepID=UPI001036360F|nr:cysteine-rich receptor-like protein kinase 25 [Camellia sinensis]
MTDPVTALALCSVNLSSSDCQTCVNAATSRILQACPSQTVAQVWYTLCMVRYSSVNFISKPDYSIGFMLYDVRDAPDQNDYDPKVRMLMQNLPYTAGVSDQRSAVGMTHMVGNRTIYGYVDCTRDVNGQDCTTCLLGATDSIPSCCLGKWAGWIATPTCNIQFDMDPVHDDWINPPEIDTNVRTATAPVTEPSAPAHDGGLMSSGGGGGDGNKERSIILVVAVVVAFILEDNRFRFFLYDLDVLVAATDNFSSTNRLGGGGFGSVYRGRVHSGEEIAVKKLTAGSTQGMKEFLNEVKLLQKIQHRNLVWLLGCCVQAKELMLVYEYLPNKSLDYFLFDKSKSALLHWAKRFNIITGVARGLLYLHEDSQLRIIHRDIKASNILLDEQMNPKISDFGLARLFNDDQSRLKTRRIVGTFGYMPPEYAIRGVVSNKTDVFSFGATKYTT